MKYLLIATIVITAVMVFTRCKTTKPGGATKPAQPEPPLENKGSEMLYRYQWNLTELQGQPVFPGGNKKAHLLFSPGQMNKVSGNTGCNNLSGNFELTGINSIKFSPMATTKMACPGDITESKFIEALEKANNWRIMNNELLLSNGEVLLAKFRGVFPERPVVMPQPPNLAGNWELNYISGRRIAFEGLYPDKKPQIQFNLTANELGGNTSCNGFSSKITINGNKINIAEPFAKTMIFCEGEGEPAFLDMLKKVNKYAVSNNTLTFLTDDIAVMRFMKK